jgi:hypothetical protein
MHADRIEAEWEQLRNPGRRREANLSGNELQTITAPGFALLAHIMKWVSIPALLAASLFSYTTARYEPFLMAVVIAGALVFVEQAVRSRDYSQAAAWIAVAVAFTPLSLAVKIFVVMGLICIASLAAFAATFHTQPAPAI